MSHGRSNVAEVRQDFEALRNEFQACHRKLESKCEALLILSRDLDQCRQQRDQFKLMAEQVQLRYQSLKRQLAGVEKRTTELDGIGYREMKQQNLAQLLCAMQEANKSLQFEVDDLKQKLTDAIGDIKLLREQIARQRVGTTDEGLSPRHFPAHEREDLVRQLEAAEAQRTQLVRDLAQVLDEKVEQETERDVYKSKYDRLNAELNRLLRTDDHHIIDIDALVMDNRYLQERMKQMEEEKAIAIATVSKYKSILERKKSRGIVKLGQNRSGGVLISQKQVQQLLETRCCLSPSTQMLTDLQSLASALLDTVSDKNVALTHHRKTNKILGSRVSELESKLRTLEQSGMWSITEQRLGLLNKLRLDCEEMRNLLPSHPDSEGSGEYDTPDTPTPPPLPHRVDGEEGGAAGVSHADLDFLPTKEAATQSSLSAGDTPLCPLTRCTPVTSDGTGAQGDQVEGAIGSPTEAVNPGVAERVRRHHRSSGHVKDVTLASSAALGDASSECVSPQLQLALSFSSECETSHVDVSTLSASTQVSDAVTSRSVLTSAVGQVSHDAADTDASPVSDLVTPRSVLTSAVRQVSRDATDTDASPVSDTVTRPKGAENC